MTCIIGYIDKKENCVWIGCDSLGSNGYTKAVESQPKIFRNEIFKNVVMGSTSTFRHIDLLKYSTNLFDTELSNEDISKMREELGFDSTKSIRSSALINLIKYVEIYLI